MLKYLRIFIRRLTRIGNNAISALVVGSRHTKLTNSEIPSRINSRGFAAANALINFLPMAGSPRDRSIAITKLIDLGDNAVQPLVDAIMRNNNQRRVDLARVLSQLRNLNYVKPISLLLYHSDYIYRAAAGEALVHIGLSAVPVLIKVLTTQSNPDIRASTKYFLARLGTHAIPALLGLLSNNDLRIRLDAIETLGFIGHHSSVSALVKQLNGNSEECIAAMLALGRIGDYRGVKPISNLVDDERENIRQTAKQALIWIGDEQRINSLVRTLWHLDNDTRWMTAQFLRYSGDERAITPLLLVLRFSLFFDVRTSIETIYALTKLDPKNPLLGNTLFDLIELMPHFYENFYDELIITTATYELGQLGDQRAIEPLFVLLQKYPFHSIIQALAKFKNKQLVPDLIRLALTCPSDRYILWGNLTQPAAAKALGEFKDERAIHPLISLLNDERQTVQHAAKVALTKIGQPAVDALITALNHPDKPVRANAATILGHIGDPRANEPLHSALHDKNKWVRREAEFALKRIATPKT